MFKRALTCGSGLFLMAMMPLTAQAGTPNPNEVEVTRENYERVINVLQDAGLNRQEIRRWIHASLDAHSGPDWDNIPNPNRIKITRKNYKRIVNALHGMGLNRQQIQRWINASVDAHYPGNDGPNITSGQVDAARVIEVTPASARATKALSDRRRDQTTDRVTDRRRDRVTDRVTDRQRDRVTDRVTDRITDRVTDRVTDRAARTTRPVRVDRVVRARSGRARSAPGTTKPSESAVKQPSQKMGRNMKRSLTYALVLAALFAANIAIADDVEFQFATGLDYSTGNYTDDVDTEILYIPANVKATFGNFQAKVAVPYIRITGPGTVVGGGEIGPITRDRAPTMMTPTVTTEEGVGDVSASLTYFTSSQDNTLFVDFTGKVKLPTASAENNLGTGETDVTLQADITKKVGDLNLLGTAGYRFMGDSDVFDLNDGFVGSAGLSYQLSKGTSASFIYDYRESASFRANSPSELTGFLTFKLSNHVRMQTYGMVGFSNGSPDTGVGFQLSYRP